MWCPWTLVFLFNILSSSVADPDPGSIVFLAKGSGSEIRIGKKSGSGINIPDNFSGSLETGFCVKNTSILWCGSGIWDLFDPGAGIWDSGRKKFGSGIRYKHPGSATCFQESYK
jgi:hypothetical protein